MKKIITLLLLLCAFIGSSSAQKLLVIELKGTVDSLDNQGRAKATIALKQEIPLTTRIKVNKNSHIRLVDQENKIMYFIKKETSGPIKEIVEEQQCTITQLAANYLKYLITKMTHIKDVCQNDRFMNGHCHATRGDTTIVDSLIQDTIIQERIVEGALVRDTILRDSIISDTTIVESSKETCPSDSTNRKEE